MFVAQGYHAAAMDDIAERAGVSKPVLYQHFPGKLELYLALLDVSCDAVIANCRKALESTQDNKLRVAATMEAFYEYVAGDTGAFRLVFESDLTNEPAVREQVDRVTLECAEMIAEVIHDDTGLPDPASRLLAVSLVGMAQVSARFWLTEAGGITEVRRVRPGGGAGLARHPRLPAHRRTLNSTDQHRDRTFDGRTQAHEGETRGGQDRRPARPARARVETDEDIENVEKLVADAVGSDGLLTLTDTRGRKILIPAARVTYVEIGGGVAGQVGFRS